MENQEIEQGLSFSDLLQLLKKNIILILICSFLGVIIGLGSAKLFKKSYNSAESQLYFVEKVNDKDYSTLIKSTAFLDKAQEIMETNYEYNYLLNSLSISFSNSSNILTIKVVDSNEEYCVAFANALAKVSETEIPIITEKKAPKIIQLAFIDNVLIKPNYVNYAVIGLLIGLILSFGIILIMYLANNNFKNQDEVMHVLGYDTLGVIYENDLNDLEVDNKSRKRALSWKK